MDGRTRHEIDGLALFRQDEDPLEEEPQRAFEVLTECRVAPVGDEHGLAPRSFFATGHAVEHQARFLLGELLHGAGSTDDFGDASLQLFVVEFAASGHRLQELELLGGGGVRIGRAVSVVGTVHRQWGVGFGLAVGVTVVGRG